MTQRAALTVEGGAAASGARYALWDRKGRGALLTHGTLRARI